MKSKSDWACLFASLLYCGCGSITEEQNRVQPIAADQNLLCDPTNTGSSESACPSSESKCALTFPEGIARLQCVAETDSLGEGQECARTEPTAGLDNCAQGLFCSALGLAGDTRKCRRLVTEEN